MKVSRTPRTRQVAAGSRHRVAAAAGPDPGVGRRRRHGMGGRRDRRPAAVPRTPAPRRGARHSSNEQFHAEQAYRYATAISIGVAIAVSALAALVVTWYFSRHVQRSVTEVAVRGDRGRARALRHSGLAAAAG